MVGRCAFGAFIPARLMGAPQQRWALTLNSNANSVARQKKANLEIKSVSIRQCADTGALRST